MRHAPVASTRYALLSRTCPFVGALHDRLDGRIGGQCGKRWTGEVDHILLLVFGQLCVTTARARLQNPRARRVLLLLLSPASAIDT